MARRSKYEMIEMDKAFDLVFNLAKSTFPLVGVRELNITGKNNGYLKSIVFIYIEVTSGMVLAEKVIAKDNLPPFRASVMV